MKLKRSEIYRIGLVLAFTIICTLLGYSQPLDLTKKLSLNSSHQDSTRFRSELNHGLTLVDSNDFDEAIVTFKKSLVYAQSLMDSIEANYQIGEIFDRKYKLDSSLQYLDVAVQLMSGNTTDLEHREKEIFAKVFRKWRVIKYDLGDYQGAREASLKEKELIDGDTSFTKRYRQLYLNMSVELWTLGKLPEAIDMAYESLVASSNLDDDDVNKKPGNLRANMMLGLIYDNMGRSEKAMTHQKLVLNIIGEDIASDAYNYMATSSNIGSIYLSWDDHEKASEHFNEALQALELIKTHATYWHFKFSILHNLGMNATAAENYFEAGQFFDKADEALGKGVPKNHPKYGTLLLSIGRNFLEAGNFPEAISNLKKGIELRKIAFGDRSSQLSEIYNEIGMAYFENEEFDNAQIYFDSALYSNQAIDLNSKLIYENSTHAILTSSYKIMNLKNTHPNPAERKTALVQIYQEIIDQANMSFILGEDISENILSLFEIIFRQTRDLYLELKDPDLQKMLWEISEYDKSRRLLVHLNEQTAFESVIPEEYSSRQAAIQDSIEKVLGYEFENTNMRDSTLTVLNTEYDNLIREIALKFPEYHRLKYSHEVISAEEVQRNLNDSQAVVEYYIGDSTSYVTVITSNLIETVQLANDSSFHANLSQFQISLRAPAALSKSGDFAQSAYALYQYLVAPVSELIGARNLTVVPSPELFLVPFDAFLTEKVTVSQTDHFNSLPFLIKERSVSYANSMTLLNNLNKKSIKNNGRILALAPTFGSKRVFQQEYDTMRNGLAPLKWTLDEIENISGQFKSDLLFEDNATESRFREIAKDYSVIHIASHGVVDDADPLYSRIVLSTNDKDSLNDGYLHTFELFNTSLNAEMAVLSACNTGFGKVQPGEGVMSLAQGFLYSGVRSTVMSLWLANDESTSKIMGSFYEHLSSGSTKDQALRHAKLDYMQSSDNLRAHPFYWAQFIANGNMEPLSRSSSTQYYLYGLTVLILILSLRYRSVFLRKRDVN